MSIFELLIIPSKIYTINHIFQEQQWDYYYAIQLTLISPTFQIRDIKNKMSPTLRPRAGPTRENANQRSKRVTTGRISPTWNRQSRSHATSKGFQNIQNVLCYRNSVIQALLHLPKFVNWVERAHRHCTSNRSSCIPCAMNYLSLSYWDEPRSQDIDSNMRRLTRCMRRAQAFNWQWDWRRQQDASEFLLRLLNAMPEQNQTVLPIVKALFEYDITQTLKCAYCHAISQQTNPEKILGVNLQNPGPLKGLLRHNVFAPATMTDWRCGVCHQFKATTELVKSLELATTPEILVVEFRRFNPDRQKDNLHIPFTQWLDLTPYTINRTPTKYRLMAVVHHSGTLNRGHYVTVARGPRGEWQRMNDHVVTDTTVTEALHPSTHIFTPYLLFYAKIALCKAITS